VRYFDTNVLINYLVEQDTEKQLQAKRLYAESAANQTFFITLLSLQELTYALAKIKVEQAEIEDAYEKWHSPELQDYSPDIFARAFWLSRYIGFKHTNDCLHTAMGEAYGCTELITYNRKDFVRIQPLTSLKIIIL
jgi:predicted nucleic acid-binding protein